MTPIPFLRLGFLILGLGIAIATASAMPGHVAIPAAAVAFAATCLAGEVLVQWAARRGARS